MYIETELTEAEALAKAAADEQVDAAVRERDALGRDYQALPQDAEVRQVAQQKVMEAFDHADQFNLNYFRLNIWGMGRCRRAMQEAGMVYDSSYSEIPDFPDYTPPNAVEGGTDALRAAEEEYEKEHEKASHVVQVFHPDGSDLIPIHKLCDNSGWHVTEEECAAAVKAWREYDVERSKSGQLAVIDEDGNEEDSAEATFAAEWWPQWIAFLDRAATRGGFRVY
jgi:hypothetical protein